MASRVIPPAKPTPQKQQSPARTKSFFDKVPLTINVRPRAVAGGVLLLLAAAVGSYASQLTLGPVYGDIPSSLYHQKICAAIFVGVWTGKGLFRQIFRRPLVLLSILAFYVPLIQRSLFKYSENWGARYGPIYTEALSFYPTLFLAVLGAACLLETPSIVLDVVPAGLSYAVFKGARDYLPGYLFHKMGSSWIYTRCGLSHLAAIFYTLISPSALLLAAVPGIFHSSLLNPSCSNTAALQYLNATLTSTNFTILAHAESSTGYISIMENSYEKYRVMRVDHSLLGGEWIAAPPGYEHVESGVLEPIYGVFVTLEAVRLIRPAPVAKVPKALMIGLGIGTSQNGLMRLGVDVHLVEIDPMVYQYAKEFFGLLPNHTAHITDAVQFVKKEAAVEKPTQYQYIIHDVFTGGAAPSSLLTTDMMEGMKKLMVDDGVIAINYAGDLKLKPAKMIIETARSVYGQCKVFREDYPQNDDKDVDFTNMVIFCTKQNKPFRFRNAVNSDFLGTYARQQFLFPQFEIDVEELFGTDEKTGETRKYGVLDGKSIAEFDEFQKESAVHHWEIMRTVIPKEGWERY